MGKDGEGDRSRHQLRPSLTDELQDLFGQQQQQEQRRLPDPRHASFEVLELESPGDTGPHAPPADRPVPAGSALSGQVAEQVQITALVISESGERFRYECSEPELTIGRAEGNTIALPDGSVSQHHARVYRDKDERLGIFDLDSTNGIYINGRRIEAHQLLASGDNVAIGDYLLRFLPGAAPPHWGDSRPPPPPPARSPSASAAGPRPDKDTAKRQPAQPPPAAAPAGPDAHDDEATGVFHSSGMHEFHDEGMHEFHDSGISHEFHDSGMSHEFHDSGMSHEFHDEGMHEFHDSGIQGANSDAPQPPLQQADPPASGAQPLHESQTRFVSDSPTLATALDQLVRRQETFERQVRERLDQLEVRLARLERAAGATDPTG